MASLGRQRGASPSLLAGNAHAQGHVGPRRYYAIEAFTPAASPRLPRPPTVRCRYRTICLTRGHTPTQRAMSCVTMSLESAS